MTATIPSAPVDATTASLLDLIDADPIHADDKATVTAAIEATAADADGLVDPNALRRRLYNEHGCIVTPNVIGTTVRNLCQSGRLVFSHWVVTEGSTSGNNGRPAKAYRLQSP